MVLKCTLCQQPVTGPAAATGPEPLVVGGQSIAGPLCSSCRLQHLATISSPPAASHSLITKDDPGDPADRLPGDQIGRFRLIRRIGEGGFGTVFLAFDPLLQRNVALKIPRFDRLDRVRASDYLREARAMAQLRSPFIVQVHEVSAGEDGESPCIVTDYIEGPTLRQWIREHAPGVRESVGICARLARGLHAAHQAGIVHRDFKPGNVLMDPGGEPMILDFGLAQWETAATADPSSASGSARSSEGRSVVGTPAYMSPEQAAGDSGSVGPTCDVWALGVVLHEMLTQERPFRAADIPGLLLQIRTAEVPPLRSAKQKIPSEISAICLKALAKQPQDRFPTALEMAEDLERFLAGQPTLTQPPPRLVQLARQTRRNWRALSVGVVLVALLVAAWIGWRSWSDWRQQLTRVALATDPPGASVVLVPINPEDGQPQADRAVTPGRADEYRLTLPQGTYLVEAVWPDGTTLQVFRLVTREAALYRKPEEGQTFDGFPSRQYLRSIGAERFHAGGRVQLPTIQKPDTMSARFVKLEGGPFQSGSGLMAQFPLVEVTIADFAMEQEEVSFARYEAVMGTLPYAYAETLPNRWPAPENRDLPVVGVSWHEAVEYAERTGSRLPTVDEYLFAATNGGTTAFPWGDDRDALPEWNLVAPQPPAVDATRHQPPIRGLFSRVAEWTGSSPGPPPPLPAFLRQNKLLEKAPSPDLDAASQIPTPDQIRILCGGGNGVKKGTPIPDEYRQGPRWFDQERMAPIGFPGLGFRTVRDLAPQWHNAAD